MKDLDLLELQKKVLKKELENSTSSSKREYLIDKILEVEKSISQLRWEVRPRVTCSAAM
jgi:hypothetical protein